MSRGPPCQWATHYSIVLGKIDLISLYFRLLWYHSILRRSIDQKHPKTNEIWRQNSEIHSAFACSHWPPWLPDLSRPYGACVKRGSGKHVFGISLFRPSWQSNISTSGEERLKYPLPWENKISQMPYSRANKDNYRCIRGWLCTPASERAHIQYRHQDNAT